VLEGIEAIMFRTIGDGPSLWESRLALELLRLPRSVLGSLLITKDALYCD
jgi:hypothetical protein